MYIKAMVLIHSEGNICVPTRLGQLQGGWLMGLVTGTLILGGQLGMAQEQPESALSKPLPSLWEAGVGEGFRKGAQELGVAAGAGYGLTVWGTRQNHDWALGTLDYGYMLTGVVGKDHWFRGNLEIVGEIFGGEQFHPDAAYLVGIGPHLRYNLATGTRWVPFIDLGGGVTATDIRNGDLSTTFEFNLQGGFGVRVFVRDNLALTFQGRFIHISNAGLDSPNLGVNNITGLVGLSWFF